LQATAGARGDQRPKPGDFGVKPGELATVPVEALASPGNSNNGYAMLYLNKVSYYTRVVIMPKTQFVTVFEFKCGGKCRVFPSLPLL